MKSIINHASIAVSISIAILNLPAVFCICSDDWTVKTYSTQDFIQKMIAPPKTGPQVGNLPTHLQYILGLD